MGYEYNFSITYRDFLGNLMSGLPREIGYYQVNVTLLEDNFQANEVVNFYVAPSYNGFINLEQTYNGKEVEEVAPDYNSVTLENGSTIDHPSVNYNVSYKGAFGDYTFDLPVNAGEYEVKVHFDHRGYVFDAYTTLVVGKAEVVWNPLKTYNAKYSGNPVSLDAIFLQGAPVFTLHQIGRAHV